jgi:hypothetical protein
LGWLTGRDDDGVHDLVGEGLALGAVPDWEQPAEVAGRCRTSARAGGGTALPAPRGRPVHSSYLSRELHQALGVLGATGAALVVTNEPYNRRGEQPDGTLYPEDQPDRVNQWNTLVTNAVPQQPHTTLLDLNKSWAPTGCTPPPSTESKYAATECTSHPKACNGSPHGSSPPSPHQPHRTEPDRRCSRSARASNSRTASQRPNLGWEGQARSRSYHKPIDHRDGLCGRPRSPQRSTHRSLPGRSVLRWMSVNPCRW